MLAAIDLKRCCGVEPFPGWYAGEKAPKAHYILCPCCGRRAEGASEFGARVQWDKQLRAVA